MLLPENFDALLTSAIKGFWTSRTSTSNDSQEGGRGAVIGGKNLDGFSALIHEIADHCHFPLSAIVTDGRNDLTIPGYYRATKMWDALVIYEGRLIAAFELKSHVGSFGNNANNRAEEAIGSASDFWIANRERAYSIENYIGRQSPKLISDDIRPPFLGYLMLLEETEESTKPTKSTATHYKVFPEFVDSSYSRKYQILCEKLVMEKMYSAACLILSNREQGIEGRYNTPTDSLSPRSFFTDFAAKLVATLEG